DTSLARTGTTTLTLANIETANLTGRSEERRVGEGGWTGGGTIDGAGGTDVIVSSTDAAAVTITDPSLARTGTTTLTLANIETANLTGGASANTFTVSGWTGGGTIDGAGGTDVIVSSTDAAAVTITDTSLARTGTTTLTLANIETANLTG